jgi:uncharacterized protein YycO
MRILIIALILLSTKSANALNAQKYLYCEDKSIKAQKLAIAIDKEQKQDIINTKYVNDGTKNLNRLNAILDRQCKGVL